MKKLILILILLLLGCKTERCPHQKKTFIWSIQKIHNGELVDNAIMEVEL